MIEIECWFGRSDGVRHSENFRVYEVGEDGAPPYVSQAELPDRVGSLEVGDYVETVDGYLSPVIKYWVYKEFRIASLKYASFSISSIRGGGKVYYVPPVGYKELRGQGVKLSLKQRSFCWVMARTWNPYLAMKEAGYKISNNGGKESDYFLQLLRSDKIKKCIMESFREQLKLAEKKEEKFVITQIENNQKYMTRILKAVTEKAENGGLDATDIEALRLSLEQSKELITLSSDLLGYKEENKVEMNAQFSYSLPAPNDLKEISNGKVIQTEEIQEAEEVKEMPIVKTEAVTDG